MEWGDLKESLETQHDTWAPEGFRSNQDGLNYCWAWSLAATLLDLRAMEGKTTVMLAPVSMGWLVNWSNSGYYLDDSIRGLRERGIAPTSSVGGDFNSTNRNPRTYKDDWETEARKYRLGEVWDVDTRQGDRATILQAATILCSGRPIYLAYNWWSHALMCTGMRWSESKKNNVIWEIRNSHGEPDTIDMDGDRGVPDELYGFVSSRLAA
jgi:hypothetical protein